jgi:hypothetical protein
VENVRSPWRGEKGITSLMNTVFLSLHSPGETDRCPLRLFTKPDVLHCAPLKTPSWIQAGLSATLFEPGVSGAG